MSDIIRESKEEKETKTEMKPVYKTAVKENSIFGTGLYGMSDDRIPVGIPGYVLDSGMQPPQYYMEESNQDPVVQLRHISSITPSHIFNHPSGSIYDTALPTLPKDKSNPTIIFESMGLSLENCRSIYEQTRSYDGNTIVVFGLNSRVDLCDNLGTLSDQVTKYGSFPDNKSEDGKGNLHLLYVFSFIWKATEDNGGYTMPFIEARLAVMERAKMISDTIKTQSKDLVNPDNRFLYRWIDGDATNDTSQELANIQWIDLDTNQSLLNAAARDNTPFVIGGGYDWRHEKTETLTGKPIFAAFAEPLNRAEMALRTKYHALLAERNMFIHAQELDPTSAIKPQYYIPEPTLLMNETAHEQMIENGDPLKRKEAQARESEQLLNVLTTPTDWHVWYTPVLRVQKPFKNELGEDKGRTSYMGNELRRLLMGLDKNEKITPEIPTLSEFINALVKVRQSAFNWHFSYAATWEHMNPNEKECTLQEYITNNPINNAENPAGNIDLKYFDDFLRYRLNQYKRKLAQFLWDSLMAQSVKMQETLNILIQQEALLSQQQLLERQYQEQLFRKHKDYILWIFQKEKTSNHRLSANMQLCLLDTLQNTEIPRPDWQLSMLDREKQALAGQMNTLGVSMLDRIPKLTEQMKNVKAHMKTLKEKAGHRKLLISQEDILNKQDELLNILINIINPSDKDNQILTKLLQDVSKLLQELQQQRLRAESLCGQQLFVEKLKARQEEHLHMKDILQKRKTEIPQQLDITRQELSEKQNHLSDPTPPENIVQKVDELKIKVSRLEGLLQKSNEHIDKLDQDIQQINRKITAVESSNQKYKDDYVFLQELIRLQDEQINLQSEMQITLKLIMLEPRFKSDTFLGNIRREFNAHP